MAARLLELGHDVWVQVLLALDDPTIGSLRQSSRRCRDLVDGCLTAVQVSAEGVWRAQTTLNPSRP